MIQIAARLWEKKKVSNVVNEPDKVYGQGATLYCLI